MTAPIKPKVRGDLAAVEIDGEAVVYDEASGDLHYLNTSATVVFSLCDGKETVRGLAGEIAAELDASVDEVEGHVRSVVRGFRRAGLLERAGA